jgi:cation:H+ antiporter
MIVTALVASLFVFTFLLIKSADITVISLRRLSRSTHASAFVLSAILLALATSFPELFVGITSALEKTPNLSLGIVLGSNIANLSLMSGLAAIITGRVFVHGDFLKRDIAIAFVAGIIPILLSLDGRLSRVDGLILLCVYLAYATSFFKVRFIEIAKRHESESFVHRFFRVINHIDVDRTKETGRLFVGIALLLASADFVVLVSKQLAVAINIPVYVIGLIIVAIGTSLPELAFSLRSLKDKEPKMFFGNILGSTIVNSSLIVGTTVLINPITQISIKDYVNSAIFFVVIALTFWYFVRSKFRLDRWEAGILVGLYIIFAVIEFF